ncbi:hypothetical protein C472_10018 [Halorubrum tebenquichense DSM 14210]|uniref:Small CPxCG-related zinc finger protein n=1 Tax=Halorubrum tebenquichense DSM 14210 TaxID=1227485 RepID=M0DN29_9EURY|nr:hypothetical protein C472_10018 [Halorubrum tebenquichense DSM 14210]
MSRSTTYRCLSCLDHVVTRSFDTSHLSRTCPNCDSFERFVNQGVIDRFEALEASPPAEFDWERLERRERLLVAERLARTDATLADVSVTERDATAESDGETDDEASAESGPDGSAEAGGGDSAKGGEGDSPAP